MAGIIASVAAIIGPDGGVSIESREFVFVASMRSCVFPTPKLTLAGVDETADCSFEVSGETLDVSAD